MGRERLDGLDPDRVVRVASQSAQVARVARQHGAAAGLVGDRDLYGIHGRGNPSGLDLDSQGRGFSGQRLVHVSEVAGTKQTVLVVVTAVIAAQCLGQDHRWDQRWPFPLVSQFA